MLEKWFTEQFTPSYIHNVFFLNGSEFLMEF